MQQQNQQNDPIDQNDQKIQNKSKSSNNFSLFLKAMEEKVKKTIGGSYKSTIDDDQALQTNYTSIDALDERQQEEELKKNEEDLFKQLFKSKEIDYRKTNDITKNADRLSADALKDAFEIKFKDENGRNIIHRAALEQRSLSLEQVFSNLENINEQDFMNLIEQTDKYGNTPLGLACVYKFQDPRKSAEMLEVVKMLLRKQANPNVCNPITYFTPLHWACVHGQTEVVKHLVESQIKPARQFIPDKKGYYPIDYAGFFKHGNTVKFLIRHLLDRMDYIRRMHQNEQQWEDFLSPYIDKTGRNGKLYTAIENPVMKFNPIFHTTILYWACMFDEIEVATVEEILNKLEAYPEGPISIDKWRTPVHAAASVGNKDKLKILMTDIYNRFQKELRPDEVRNYNKKQLCLYFNNRWQSLLRQKRYIKLKEFNDKVFQAKLNQYKSMKKFKFDFLDKFLNSPLHIASQNGKELCVQMLIQEYDLQLDIRNQEGWVPKDIVQHESVNKVYMKFYKKLDKLFNQTVSGSQNAGGPRQSISAGPSEKSIKFAQINSQNTQMISSQVINNNNKNNKKEDQLTEKQIMNKELIKCRDLMPKVPPLVLKVNVKESSVINKMIQLLEYSGFQIQMFPSITPEQYYIALHLPYSIIEKEAKEMHYSVKLCEIDSKQVYEPNQKARFEPFRSKDIQQIMISLLNKMVNVQQLTKQKILLQIIPMHDFYGVYDIKTKWEKSSKLPMPISILNQFFTENMNFQYRELGSLKNYFGEKIAFLYAWWSFYTAWLVIPGILGLAISIYQYVAGGIETVFTAIYAILVCFWVTIFIEKWKRKSSEISLKWGVLGHEGKNSQIMREEFNGDEYFSFITHQVDKKSAKSRMILTLILQVPIFIILIGGCIAMYFAIIQIKDKKTGDTNLDSYISTLAGVLNSCVIQIINFIYQKLALLFVKIENHKYQHNYERSYVFKLFVFKFINTNISLFYTAFIDQNFESLYFVLIGMVLQKAVQIFFLKQTNFYLSQFYRNGTKLFKYWLLKKLYFKKVAALAKDQYIQHQNFINELDQETRETLVSKQQEIQSKPLFSKITDTQPMYQRLVFSTSTNIEESQVMIDYVELNSLMPEKSDQQDIIETSEMFILLSLATLYSCACPLAALIVMIHNLVDMNFDIKSNYIATRRPIARTRNNIGPWLVIAEFMAVAAVISNCLLLYFSTPKLKQFFANQFDISSEIYFLWIIVAFEHFIIVIKGFFSAVITDIPGWVSRSQQRVEKEVDNLMIEEAERDENEKIKLLKNRLIELATEKRETLSRLKEKVKQLKSEMGRKDSLMIDYDKVTKAEIQKKEEELKGVKILEQIKKEEETRKKPEDLKLVDFLGIQKGEWFAKEREKELEKALARNFQRRLMLYTYTSFEREIIARRVSKIFDTKKVNQINCAQCQQSLATIECIDCQDHYCLKCQNEIHNSSQVFQMHQFKEIPLEVQQFTLIKPISSGNNNQSGIVTSKIPIWKKFEYYNFPIQDGNDLYQYVQKHFVYLREHYIEQNYIDDQGSINYQCLFVDKQYDLLTDFQAKVIMNKDKKLFGDSTMQCQYHMFNDEELFYMNKVAFYLFRHKGENLTFTNFTSRLNMLQTAPYQKRCTLWLSILDEKGDENIPKSAIESVFRISFIQDITQQKKDTEILNLIFGDNQLLTINKIIEVMNKNEDVKAFMIALLQYNQKEVQEL